MSSFYPSVLPRHLSLCALTQIVRYLEDDLSSLTSLALSSRLFARLTCAARVRDVSFEVQTHLQNATLVDPSTRTKQACATRNIASLDMQEFGDSGNLPDWVEELELRGDALYSPFSKTQSSTFPSDTISAGEHPTPIILAYRLLPKFANLRKIILQGIPVDGHLLLAMHDPYALDDVTLDSVSFRGPFNSLVRRPIAVKRLTIVDVLSTPVALVPSPDKTYSPTPLGITDVFDLNALDEYILDFGYTEECGDYALRALPKTMFGLGTKCALSTLSCTAPSSVILSVCSFLSSRTADTISNLTLLASDTLSCFDCHYFAVRIEKALHPDVCLPYLSELTSGIEIAQALVPYRAISKLKIVLPHHRALSIDEIEDLSSSLALSVAPIEDLSVKNMPFWQYPIFQRALPTARVKKLDLSVWLCMSLYNEVIQNSYSYDGYLDDSMDNGELAPVAFLGVVQAADGQRVCFLPSAIWMVTSRLIFYPPAESVTDVKIHFEYYGYGCAGECCQGYDREAYRSLFSNPKTFRPEGGYLWDRARQRATLQSILRLEHILDEREEKREGEQEPDCYLDEEEEVRPLEKITISSEWVGPPCASPYPLKGRLEWTKHPDGWSNAMWTGPV